MKEIINNLKNQLSELRRANSFINVAKMTKTQLEDMRAIQNNTYSQYELAIKILTEHK